MEPCIRPFNDWLGCRYAETARLDNADNLLYCNGKRDCKGGIWKSPLNFKTMDSSVIIDTKKGEREMKQWQYFIVKHIALPLLRWVVKSVKKEWGDDDKVANVIEEHTEAINKKI